MCIGLLKGLYYLSSDDCIPPAITIGAVARMVVKYIDDRPTRMHEDFRELALEALKTAWPCSRNAHHQFQPAAKSSFQ
jgi:hypothetical protein